MFDVRYKDFRLIPSKTAARELTKYGFMIYDCREILEKGYSPRKRKQGKGLDFLRKFTISLDKKIYILVTYYFDISW